MPALNIFKTSLDKGKFDESRKLSDGSLMTFSHIYPMDAVFDTMADVPEEVRGGGRGVSGPPGWGPSGGHTYSSWVNSHRSSSHSSSGGHGRCRSHERCHSVGPPGRCPTVPGRIPRRTALGGRCLSRLAATPTTPTQRAPIATATA